MRELVWSEDAEGDLVSLVRYISEDSPAQAQLVKDRIEVAVENLVRQHYGRKGRVPETFEVIVPRTRYIVAYTVMMSAENIEQAVVLHIIHGAQEWLAGEWPSNT